jgi:hypothetical protein
LPFALFFAVAHFWLFAPALPIKPRYSWIFAPMAQCSAPLFCPLNSRLFGRGFMFHLGLRRFAPASSRPPPLRGLGRAGSGFLPRVAPGPPGGAQIKGVSGHRDFGSKTKWRNARPPGRESNAFRTIVFLGRGSKGAGYPPESALSRPIKVLCRATLRGCGVAASRCDKKIIMESRLWRDVYI